MRLKLGIALVLLSGLLFGGCKPTKHPRRDRKARAGVSQNADAASKLAATSAGLSDAQKEIREALAALEAAHTADVAALRAELGALKGELDALAQKEAQTAEKCQRVEALLAGLEREGNVLVLTGVNLRLQDAKSGPPALGLGNLLIGRDEALEFKNFYRRDPVRTGSNNLIIGGRNEYLGSGGLCVGVLNLLNGDASVVFSCENEIKNKFGSVLGGTNNLSQGRFATVGGGRNRVVSGDNDFRAGHLFSDQ